LLSWFQTRILPTKINADPDPQRWLNQVPKYFAVTILRLSYAASFYHVTVTAYDIISYCHHHSSAATVTVTSYDIISYCHHHSSAATVTVTAYDTISN
jgi:hypothetical protein